MKWRKWTKKAVSRKWWSEFKQTQALTSTRITHWKSKVLRQRGECIYKKKWRCKLCPVLWSYEIIQLWYNLSYKIEFVCISLLCIALCHHCTLHTLSAIAHCTCLYTLLYMYVCMIVYIIAKRGEKNELNIIGKHI